MDTDPMRLQTTLFEISLKNSLSVYYSEIRSEFFIGLIEISKPYFLKPYLKIHFY